MTTRATNFLADEFFHLVGSASPDDHEANYGTLEAILDGGLIRYRGCEPRAPTTVEIDLTRSLASGQMINPRMTCYCDILFRDLPFHARKYGWFGLSFARNLLIRRGARPVMYVPVRSDDYSSAHGATLLRDVEVTYRAFREMMVDPMRERSKASPPPHVRRKLGVPPSSVESLTQMLESTLSLYLLSFVKAYDSELDVNDPEFYYSEREWRMTNYLSFVAEDVESVVVEESYLERAKQDFPAYSAKVRAMPKA